MSARKGNTLIEVMMASIILAMTAAAIGGLLLSTFIGPKKGNAQYEIAFAAKKLREQLKSYVSADTSVTLNAPGSPPWHLPYDSSCQACWALADGAHDATTMLSDDLRTRYNATMRYTVTREVIAGRQVPKVQIVVNWNMP